MTTPDPVKVALIVGGAATAVLMVCTAIVLFHNGQSRNLALGAGTLGGALVLLVTQTWYELRSTTEREFVGVTYTVDRGERTVMALPYSVTNRFASSGMRVFAEQDAYTYAGAKTDSDLFAGQDAGTVLAKDMVLYSIVAFVAASQLDWQLDIRPFGTQGGSTFSRVSDPSYCTFVEQDDLRRHLETAGNLYAPAGVRASGKNLCLPPRTTIQMTRDVMTIENPFCRIEVANAVHGVVSYVDRKTRDRVNLPTGESRFEEHPFGISVVTVWSPLRAHHSELPKYHIWVDRFRGALREWFEGRAADGTRSADPTAR